MNIYWGEHEGENRAVSEELPITHKFVEEQKVVGGYDITGNGGGAWSVMFMMRNKPRRFHRFCSKLFLGWVWVDKVN